MFEKNTAEVNKIITRTLALCSLALIALLIMDSAGVFNFTERLKNTIMFLGLFITISPLVLRLLRVPDTVLKYYTLIGMAVLVGVMGTFNGIGIYISYVLVPVVSCIYFDKKLTWFCMIFSYLCMAAGVWFNTASRWEIVYKNWSHVHAFELYMIGFSVEYIIVGAFIFQFVRRANKFMTDQHVAMLAARTEEEKYKMLSMGIKDIFFEYDPIEDHYVANRSIYSDSTDDTKVDLFGFNEVMRAKDSLLAHRILKIQEDVMEEDTFSKDVDFSYMKDGKEIPLWYRVDARVIFDEDNEDYHMIGKLHNITSQKLGAKGFGKERLSAFLLNGVDSEEKKNSMTAQLLKEYQEFTEEDFVEMAQAHQVLAGISDQLKTSHDTKEALDNALEKFAIYLEVDRLVFLSGLSENDTTVAYQWAIKPDIRYPETMTFDKVEDVEFVKKLYDQNGYLEFNPTHDKNIVLGDVSDNFVNQVVKNSFLGNQIWVPALVEGEYIGAIFFDRFDTTPYTPAQKFFMAEAANILNAHMAHIKAENASRAKSAYLSTMSHEIRTPMNAIIGMTDIALRKDMPEDVKKCLQTIKSASSGLLVIINDILDFSKIEAGKIDIVEEEYQTLSLVNDLKTMASARNAEKMLELNFHVGNDLPARLKGDAVRIKQVMVNLATNAIKYTNEGTVDIYVSAEKNGDEQAVLKYRVTDTGMGIKDDEKKRLFAAYSQVDVEKNHRKEGTGLGLAISKQFIELMGGSMFFESEYGKGSTFGFDLPQVIVDDSASGDLDNFEYSDTQNFDINDYRFPGAKMLLVDDNEINLEVVIALLEPLEFEIDTAGDGTEAIEKCKEKKYDIILMDNFMPKMNGGEATERIRAQWDEPNVNTPIIALTADAVSGVKEQLLATGMNDFITKPIDLKKLCKALKKWVKK